MATPRIDVVDDTFIRCPPGVVRAVFDEAALADLAWPRLRRTLLRDRGVKGLRWTVTGDVEGSMEVWLEPWRDGVVVHHYLRGRAVTGSPLRVARRHTARWKSVIHAVKDELEGRPLYPSGHGRQH